MNKLVQFVEGIEENQGDAKVWMGINPSTTG